MCVAKANVIFMCQEPIIYAYHKYIIYAKSISLIYIKSQSYMHIKSISYILFAFAERMSYMRSQISFSHMRK